MFTNLVFVIETVITSFEIIFIVVHLECNLKCFKSLNGTTNLIVVHVVHNLMNNEIAVGVTGQHEQNTKTAWENVLKTTYPVPFLSENVSSYVPSAWALQKDWSEIVIRNMIYGSWRWAPFGILAQKLTKKSASQFCTYY